VKIEWEGRAEIAVSLGDRDMHESGSWVVWRAGEFVCWLMFLLFLFGRGL
jgi:hypothetical protein